MSLQLFDTHCHPHEMVRRTTPVYDKWRSDGVERDPDEVIQAAREVGVEYMICVGTTAEDSEQAIDFVKGRENLWASVGIHPHEASETLAHKRNVTHFASLVESEKVVAVGECGLDYFYDHSSREDQLAMLHFQIELALAAELPLIFHVRDAFADFWPIFEEYQIASGGKLRGVLHSFTDNIANLERAISHGLYVGVNGIATFAKTPENNVIYRTIPQHLLLLETDAPFLTPTPFRGKVCESKHLRVTAEYLAGLRDVSLEELAEHTTANAHALFGI